MRSRSNLKRKIIRIIRFFASKIKIILLLIFIIALVWFVSDYIDAKKQVALLSNSKTQQKVYQKEIEEIIKQVSKLIILPEGQPNIATIQDIKTLVAEQPFFKKAENGDKVLIYKDKVIIFSPTKNILVNVGPVYTQGKDTASSTKQVSIKNKKEEQNKVTDQ